MLATSRTRRLAALAATSALALLAGCGPRARPLVGVPAPAVLPRAELPPGRQRYDFRWEYQDGDVVARGDGVARVAAPDSIRLDFFLDGGLGGGYAVVLGNDVFAPGGEQVRRFLPPPPLLWASLGRLAVPPSPDTSARVDGGTLRADIGRDPTWRASFAGARLTRLERIDDGRIAEWVSRDSSSVHYVHTTARRALTLSKVRSQPAGDFDATIWTH
ncbi:MAG TPA: hypothetical protein VFJ74_08500 [Gemmatimonadaceae bacterium]|nr:hypothetical protein [Gemmatimonadaceae bacterium]